MQHEEFRIGETFWCSGREWRCTDVGTRTVIAIRIDSVSVGSPSPELRRTLWQVEAEAAGWFNGPPYAVAEHVFDEDGIKGCTPEPPVVKGDLPLPGGTLSATARRWFAEELRFVANLRSRALVDAFATVPRERFVGRGPWRIRSPMDRAEYWTTEDANPRHVYHDALIALDEVRGLNNGQPSLWAGLLNQLGLSPGEQVLHLGCGTGYYSAIVAELVGPAGSVAAVEIDAGLAGQARAALAPWPQATVVQADGSIYEPGPTGTIIVSAGATHPLALWLNSLKPGGRLLVPLTADDRWGAILLVTRQEADGFAARFIRPVGFIAFAGARNPGLSVRLANAFARGDARTVKSLRRDAHEEDETCWLHGGGWCLSRREPG